VNITGVDFTGATAVEFGSTAASSFTVNSATSITAVSPARAVVGIVYVRVTTPAGTSRISSKDTFTFTPTVTSVSPNTGPPAGGTLVTVTGTGFAVGETATQISLGGGQAVSVNCTTTTECTASTPELRRGVQYDGTVQVRATVKSVVSPTAPANQFDYHGLYLRGEQGRLPVGEFLKLRVEIAPRNHNSCDAYVAAIITANGETTDAISAGGVEHYNSCLPYEWFGVLPGTFTLRINSDKTASIEGRMGVGRNTGGCVYEGNKMSGGFETDFAPFEVSVNGTFTFIEEEEPGEECSQTESVGMLVAASQGIELELIQ
jgi:hypothetical protein